MSLSANTVTMTSDLYPGPIKLQNKATQTGRDMPRAVLSKETCERPQRGRDLVFGTASTKC